MRLKLTFATVAILICAYSSPAWAAPVMVTCGPGQHAIVHDTYLRGSPVTRVSCAGSARDVAQYRAYPVERRHRSWGKTALVIGAGAGTGAGVGGIVHGKKGALIGAALGGGAASLYEAAHRR